MYGLHLPEAELAPKPRYSDQWLGREPTAREMSEEFRNVYRLLQEIQEKLVELSGEDDGGGSGP